MNGVVLFTLGPIKVFAYGFMAGLSVLITTFFTLFFLKKENLYSFENFLFIVTCGFITFTGGRILGLIQNHDFNIFSHTGMSFFGGIFSLLFFIFGLYRIFYRSNLKDKKTPKYLPSREDFLHLINIVFILLPLSMSIWRIGCLIEGCCGGIPTDFIINITGRHPTQLYSAISNFIIFIILLKIRKRKYTFLLPYYLIFYSIFRFLIEFIRKNDYHFLGLSVAQYFSLLVFIIGLIVFFGRKRKTEKDKIR